MALEKYQSEFTAEDFENAIRAVPSIGANGNWFIGDTDTGIYAGGVKVENAEIGQTIMVKAVDENGKPTKWEAIDRSPAWELIYSGEITEDVTGIVVDKDNNGNAFSLKEYKLVITTVAATENPNSSFSWYTHNDDGGGKGPFYTITNAAGERTLMFEGKLCGNCWYCQYVTASDNTAAQGSKHALWVDGKRNGKDGPATVPVYKLKLVANAGNTCGAGSQVALFGVRA